MKKRFGLFSVVWAVELALFNLIAFIVPGIPGVDKFTPSFWIGYSLITVMFLGQLICGYVALKEENLQKLFYRISLIKTSYAGSVATFIIGGLCMLIAPLPYWIGAIACAIVLVANVVAIVKATAAVGEVERIDQKIKVQTFFIKALTVDADTLMARAKSDDAKANCKKVYEAVRYADPMSNDALSGVEGQITLKFAAFSDAVCADEADRIAELANELLILINDRNKKCKLLK